MNAILLGAASLGALIVAVTRDPSQLQVASMHAREAADDAEVARLMAEAPDEGSVGTMTWVDPKTGEKAEVDVLAFKD
jgi:hypothetical protein